MKLNKNGTKQKNLENENGIIEILEESKNAGWKIIGEVKKWIRICPNCNEEVYHTTKKNRDKLEKNKVLCKICSSNSENRRINLRTTWKKKINFYDESEHIKYVLIDGKNMWIRKCPLCKNEIIHKQHPRKFQLKNPCIICKRIERKKKTEKEYQKICIQCKKIVYYKQKVNLDNRNKPCRECKKKNTAEKNIIPLKRVCPTCNKILIYKNRYRFLESIDKNKKCQKCASNTVEHKQKLSISNSGIKRNDEFKKNASRTMKGRKITWGDKITKSLMGRIVSPESEMKRLESRLGMKYDDWLKLKPEYFKYKTRVMSITRRQPIYLLENSDKKRTLAGISGGYQLDHIITIYDGFKNHINPHIIGHVKNLKIISWEENLKKNKKTEIVIDDKYKNNVLNTIENELLKILVRHDNRFYKAMKLITDKWYENPNFSRDEAIQIAKSVDKI